MTPSLRGEESPADAIDLREELHARPVACVTLDAGGVIARFDAEAERVLGRAAPDVVGRDLVETLVVERDRHALRALLRGAGPGAGSVRARLAMVCSDGAELPVELTLTRIDAPAPGSAHPAAFSVLLHDLSERRLAEQVTAATNTVIRAMVRAESPDRAMEALLATLGTSLGWEAGTYWSLAHDGGLDRVADWHGEGVEVETQPDDWHGEGVEVAARPDAAAGHRLAREFSFPGHVLELGTTVSVGDVDVGRIVAPLGTVGVPVRRAGEPIGVMEFQASSPRPLDRATRRALAVAGEQVGELLGILEDRHKLVTSLARLALTDQLTGLPNRRAWEEALARELARAARGGQPVCVAVLDLDGFKAFNDEHGHQAGDRLLTQAARAWQRQLRVSDLLARYGGEEFAAVIPAWPLEIAVEVVERLRRAAPGGLTASAGVASWDGSESGAQLFGRADAALYAAKQAGRDRTVAAELRAPRPD